MHTFMLRFVVIMAVTTYFSIHNARVIYIKKSKFVKNEHVYTFERHERWIKCQVEVLLNIYWTIKLFKSKKFFIRLNITTITTSNVHASKEFLHPNSTTS
jgi:hypothetical protein